MRYQPFRLTIPRLFPLLGGLFGLLILSLSTAQGQTPCDSCQVDTTQFTVQTGFQPLPTAPGQLNQPYNDSLIFISPNDTTVDLPGLPPITARTKKIEIDSVFNLPQGLNWSSGDTIFPDYDSDLDGTIGPAGCFRFCGTPTAVTDVADSVLIAAKFTGETLGGFSQAVDTVLKVKIAVYGERTLRIDTIPGNELCAGETTTLSFTSREAFRQGNSFRVQLVNPNLNYTQIIGATSTTAAGQHQVQIQVPDNLTSDNDYRLRILATEPAIEGMPYGPAITISNPEAQVQVENATCGSNDGQINITGLQGASSAVANNIQYALNNQNFSNQDSFPNRPAGLDTLYMHAIGCTWQQPVSVPDTGAPSLSLQADTLQCGNDSSGQIIATASGANGPFTYSFDGGASFQAQDTFNQAATGTYFVLAQNANGCIAADSITVAGPQPLQLFLSKQAITCFNSKDGQVAVSAVNHNQGEVLYGIDGGALQSDSSFSNLLPDTHVVRVVDTAGCTNATLVSLRRPDSLSLSTSTSPEIEDSTAGTATASASGGRPPYRYRWSTNPTSTGDSIGGLLSGTYGVTVIDANGCRKTDSVTVDLITARPGATRSLALKVFPNPVERTLTVVVPQLQDQPMTLQLTDLTGRTVYNRALQPTAEQPRLTIDVQDLPQGVYHLQLRSNGRQTSRQVIVR